MDLILPVLERFGFPSAVVAAGIVIVWRMSKWFAREVALPLVTSHVQVVDTLRQNVQVNTGTLQSMAINSQAQTALLQDVAAIQRQQNEQLAKILAMSQANIQAIADPARASAPGQTQV